MITFNTDVVIESNSWEEFIKFINGTIKSLTLFYADAEEEYHLFFIDGSVAVKINILKDGITRSCLDSTQNDLDRTDFEANFKSAAIKYS